MLEMSHHEYKRFTFLHSFLTAADIHNYDDCEINKTKKSC